LLSVPERRLNVANDIRLRRITLSAEVSQIREVEHDARCSIGGLGKDRRATVVCEENVAFSVLRAKRFLSKLQYLPLTM
jgi:hypothetical protein